MTPRSTERVVSITATWAKDEPHLGTENWVQDIWAQIYVAAKTFIRYFQNTRGNRHFLCSNKYIDYQYTLIFINLLRHTIRKLYYIILYSDIINNQFPIGVRIENYDTWSIFDVTGRYLYNCVLLLLCVSSHVIFSIDYRVKYDFCNIKKLFHINIETFPWNLPESTENIAETPCAILFLVTRYCTLINHWVQRGTFPLMVSSLLQR